MNKGQSAPVAGLQVAASRFFRRSHDLSLPRGSSGFSGSVIARVEAHGKSWCLRAWPVGFERRRLGFVHKVLRHSRASGFSGVPLLATTSAGDTVLNLDGRLFDAQEWLPGEPLSGEPTWEGPAPNAVRPLGLGTLSSVTRAVARFHRSTVGLQPERDGRESLSAQLPEVAREAAVRGVLLTGVEARARGRERRVALRWLELLPVALRLAEEGLRRHPAGAVDISTLCHGDLWASHVHFAGSDFAGLLDFESLCFSSPVLDLTQLILHFNGWTSREAVVDSYQKVRPLRGEDLAALPTAGAMDLAREGSWSLGRLYTEEGGLLPSERRAHEANLSKLLGSLEMVLAEARKADRN